MPRIIGVLGNLPILVPYILTLRDKPVDGVAETGGSVKV
jgi:hypothetical protein